MFKKILSFFKKKPTSAPSKPVVPSDIEKQIDEVVANKLPSCFYLLRLNPNVSYWQGVIKALAYAESSFNVLETFWEKDLGDNGYDRVNGSKYLSEGLTQLSYSDKQYYQCEFDWEADKHKDEKDPTKSIFDVRKNIECAMTILNKAVKREGKFIFNSGNYWAVLKPSNKRHQVFLNRVKYYGVKL